jgi:serine/threonine-protein kinase
MPPDAADLPVAAGDCVAGKYRVEHIIGRGGMSVVVAAKHLGLDERVALKFLRRGVPSGDALDRFRREARAAARIKSEHVARVLDCDVLDSGLPYIVIEYLEGTDLERLLQNEGPFPVVRVVDLVLQAAEALAEAHAKGIVHRDIKPANLFLARREDGSETVKLLDFGIAKLFEVETERSMTDTSEVLGSPRYMAPEQLRSARAATGRSDIWALGVTLYELLGGRTPFERGSRAETSSAILHDDPTPLVTLRADLDPELVAIIEACLQKDRGARPGTVAEVATKLAPFGSGEARASAARIQRWRPAEGAATEAGSDASLSDPESLTGSSSSLAGAEPRTRRALSVTLVAVALLALGFVAARAGRDDRARPPGEPVEAVPQAPAAQAPAEPSLQPKGSFVPSSPPGASTGATAPAPPPARLRATPAPKPLPSATPVAPAPLAEMCPDPLCARK